MANCDAGQFVEKSEHGVDSILSIVGPAPRAHLVLPSHGRLRRSPWAFSTDATSQFPMSCVVIDSLGPDEKQYLILAISD